MRKFSAIALVSCLTLGATAVFAQTTPSTSASSSASKTTTSTTKTTKSTTAKTKAKAMKVTGDISKLDCTAKTLTVGTTDLSTNDSTHVMKAGKKAACTDLKDGDKATASYTTDKDGKSWAKYISVK